MKVVMGLKKKKFENIDEVINFLDEKEQIISAKEDSDENYVFCKIIMEMFYCVKKDPNCEFKESLIDLVNNNYEKLVNHY